MNMSKAARQRLGHSCEDFDKVVAIDEDVMRRLGFDYPLKRHASLYHWLTQEYLTRDYSPVDMLKLAHIMESYPREAIEKAVRISRVRQQYNAPYLAGILEREGAQMIEDVRREQRIEQMVQQTKPPVLPDGQYPELTRDLYQHEILRDDAAKNS